MEENMQTTPIGAERAVSAVRIDNLQVIRDIVCDLGIQTAEAFLCLDLTQEEKDTSTCKIRNSDFSGHACASRVTGSCDICVRRDAYHRSLALIRAGELRLSLGSQPAVIQDDPAKEYRRSINRSAEYQRLLPFAPVEDTEFCVISRPVLEHKLSCEVAFRNSRAGRLGAIRLLQQDQLAPELRLIWEMTHSRPTELDITSLLSKLQDWGRLKDITAAIYRHFVIFSVKALRKNIRYRKLRLNPYINRRNRRRT